MAEQIERIEDEEHTMISQAEHEVVAVKFSDELADEALDREESSLCSAAAATMVSVGPRTVFDAAALGIGRPPQ